MSKFLFYCATLTLLAADAARGAAWNVYPDGTGDAPTIAGAIALAAPGDSVLLHPGIYNENGLVVEDGNLSILGQGLLPEDVTIDAGGQDLLQQVSGETLRVQNLSVRSADEGLNLRARAVVIDVLMEDCTLGLRVFGNSWVEGCRFARNERGLRSHNNDNVISDCSFSFHTDYALSILGGGVVRCHFEQNDHAVFFGTRDVTVLDCTFDDAGPSLVSCRSFLMRDCRFSGASQLQFDGRFSFDPADVEDCQFRNMAAPAVQQEVGSTNFTDCFFDGVGTGAWLHLIEGGVTVGGSTIRDFGLCADMESGSLDFQNSIIAEWAGEQLFTGRGGGNVTATCTDFYGANALLDPQVRSLQAQPTNLRAAPAFCDSAGSTGIAAYSRCAPDNNVCGVRIGHAGVGCPGPGVYVHTEPAGLLVGGDGVLRVSAAAFGWSPGSVHELSAPSPQSLNGLTRYVFSSWDDGGAQAHDVLVSQDEPLATATFDTEHHLAVSSTPGGAVTEISAFYPMGDSVAIEAFPDSGFALMGWSGSGNGSYDGTALATTVVMNAPIVQQAFFGPSVSVTVRTDPSGQLVRINQEAFTTPVTRSLARNTTVTIGIDELHDTGPGTRLRFDHWSHGAARNHSLFLPNAGDPVEITATLSTEYALTFATTPDATTLPGDGWHAVGTSVQIEAIPDFQSEFVSWTGEGSGAYTGPANPASVSVNSPIHQTANLAPRFDGSGYDFTISASSTDPFAPTDVPADGVRELFLWGACLQRGLSAFTGRVTGTLSVLAFQPAPAVLNAGDAIHPLLAVGGCPGGTNAHFLLGTWIVLDHGGWICFADPDSVFAVDCDGGAFPSPGVIGFASGGTSPCEIGENGCAIGTVPVRLSQLAAVSGDRAVRVSWSTTAAIRHDGFHVYRSRSLTGTPSRLTADLIRGLSPYEWLDSDVIGDGIYYYRVGAVDVAGSEQMFGPVRVETPAWKPFLTEFRATVPNPSSSSVVLRFALARAEHVSLVVYDVAGRRVNSLQSGELSAGEHEVIWDGRSSTGRLSPAGVYFARFVAGGTHRVRKLMRLGNE